MMMVVMFLSVSWAETGWRCMIAGMRVVIRGMGWPTTKIETNALGNDVASGSGILPLDRD